MIETKFDLTKFSETTFGSFECKHKSGKCAINSVSKIKESYVYNFKVDS